MAAKLVLLLCVLVVILESQRTEGFGLSLGLLQGIGKWRTVLSLSQSLMNRVANVRASRGDLEGAERARKIADKMGGGGLGLGFWSVGWDYARSYAWRDAASSDEILGAVSDSNEVLDALKELNSMKLEREKARWVYENYQRVLGPSRSLLRRLLLVFTRSVSFPILKIVPGFLILCFFFFTTFAFF